MLRSDRNLTERLFGDGFIKVWAVCVCVCVCVCVHVLGCARAQPDVL
jgi:hypothetical protein